MNAAPRNATVTLGLMPSLLQEVNTHVEKPSGDGYHANGQADSEVWSEPLMDPGEPRRPRLTFSNTYVGMLFIPYKGECMKNVQNNCCLVAALPAVEVCQRHCL